MFLVYLDLYIHPFISHSSPSQNYDHRRSYFLPKQKGFHVFLCNRFFVIICLRISQISWWYVVFAKSRSLILSRAPWRFWRLKKSDRWSFETATLLARSPADWKVFIATNCASQKSQIRCFRKDLLYLFGQGWNLLWNVHRFTSLCFCGSNWIPGVDEQQIIIIIYFRIHFTQRLQKKTHGKKRCEHEKLLYYVVSLLIWCSIQYTYLVVKQSLKTQSPEIQGLFDHRLWALTLLHVFSQRVALNKSKNPKILQHGPPYTSYKWSYNP